MSDIFKNYSNCLEMKEKVEILKGFTRCQCYQQYSSFIACLSVLPFLYFCPACLAQSDPLFSSLPMAKLGL